MKKYTSNKTALASMTLAACIVMYTTPTSAMTLLQNEASDTQIEQKNPLEGKVILMVLREGINHKIERETLVLSADEAEAKKAELLNDPFVISVEEATTYSVPPTPKMGNSRAQSHSQASSSANSTSNEGPLYWEQSIFPTYQEHNLQLEPALRRMNHNNTIRVGVIDGGFESSIDMTYAEGVNLSELDNTPRGSLFLNEDIECGYVPPNGITQHGHHVSHIIGATPNNSLGIAGTSVNVEMVAARVLNCAGNAVTSDIIDGILWMGGNHVHSVSAISKPVDVINISISGEGPCPHAMQTAIDEVTNKGIKVVVAAGNYTKDTADYSPANCRNVITVASSRSNGNLSDFTNTGDEVDVTAYGSYVESMTPDGEPAYLFGTSFSSPIVAGMIATTLSDRPNLTPAQVEGMIARSGKPIIESPDFNNLGSGAGILDAMRFLDAAGIPRELVATQSVLTGERERYQEALLHPYAKKLIKTETGKDVCDLVEVDGRTITPSQDYPLTAFSVTKGEPLDPSSTDAVIIKQTAGNRMTVGAYEFQNTDRDYGFARCDIDTGADCNQIDTIRGINPAELDRPAVCEATTVASR